MYFKGTDMITIDKGFKYGIGYSNANVATFAARPVFDRQPAPTEMFWFLFQFLTEADLNKTDDGPQESFLYKEMAGNAHFQLLMASSPPAIKQHDVDNDRQRPLLQHGDQHDGSRDVSPPDDNGRQGTLSQPEDRDLHGAQRKGEEEKIVTQ